MSLSSDHTPSLYSLSSLVVKNKKIYVTDITEHNGRNGRNGRNGDPASQLAPVSAALTTPLTALSGGTSKVARAVTLRYGCLAPLRPLHHVVQNFLIPKGRRDGHE